jgi:hypothetical protein
MAAPPRGWIRPGHPGSQALGLLLGTVLRATDRRAERGAPLSMLEDVHQLVGNDILRRVALREDDLVASSRCSGAEARSSA